MEEICGYELFPKLQDCQEFMMMTQLKRFFWLPSHFNLHHCRFLGNFDTWRLNSFLREANANPHIQVVSELPKSSLQRLCPQSPDSLIRTSEASLLSTSGSFFLRVLNWESQSLGILFSSSQ